jgi:EmrB/QacA subfamily drug resistance transporter
MDDMSTSEKDTRWAALIVLCVGFFMIVLDATVVNVALPSIQEELGFSQSSLAWVVNAYMIAFGGLLLLAGRLGDLLGRRRVFLAGLVVFTLASMVCGVAQSQEVLVAARFIQGIGGAMASAVILGMIVTMFPDPLEQGKAIGIYGFVASGGGSAGLLAGGLLTDAINWHWIFFINVPIGIATGLLALRLIADDEGIGLREGADAPGAVLVTGSLMLGVYTIVGAAEHGWGATRTLLLGAVSLALMAAFLVRQSRIANPLVPLRIFRSRAVSVANIVQVLAVAGMFGMFFLGALYLQQVLGYSPIGVGLAFLPTTLVMGIMSVRYSARLVNRFGARATILGGMPLVLLGLALFARVPVDGTWVVDVLPSMLLLGLGAGTAFPAIVTLAMSAATPRDAGLASGLVNTTAQVGGALGLAILATLAADRSDTLLAGGTGTAEALTQGYRLALIVGTALVGVAIAVVVAVLRPEPEPEPEPQPEPAPHAPAVQPEPVCDAV